MLHLQRELSTCESLELTYHPRDSIDNEKMKGGNDRRETHGYEDSSTNWSEGERSDSRDN